MKEIDLRALLPSVEKMARQAGAEIMKHYNGTTVYTKNDGSKVTDADYAAENIVLPALQTLTPGIPIVSEERVANGDTPDISKGTFWTVDPLDGTHEFIDKTGAFVVAIALIVDNKPVLGVVYHPAMDIMYLGYGPGTGVKIDETGARIPLPAGITGSKEIRVLANKPHADMTNIEGYLREKFGNAAKIDSKSGILRACQIADGLADMSVTWAKRRNGRTAFWDVAPGHAIVESAGGRVETLSEQPLMYDCADLHVEPHVMLSPAPLKKPEPKDGPSP